MAQDMAELAEGWIAFWLERLAIQHRAILETPMGIDWRTRLVPYNANLALDFIVTILSMNPDRSLFQS